MFGIRSGKLAVRATLLIAAIILAPLAAQGSWVVNMGNTIKLNNGPGTLAGEFTVGTTQSSSGSADATSGNYATPHFSTFCVQVNEYFNYNEVLTIRGITQFSEAGHQPLAAQTAALYGAFMSGYESNSSSLNFFGNSSASYNYASPSTRASDADLLQKAIWHFQGQGTYVASEMISNNKFVAAVSSLSSSVLASAGIGVSILNLTRVVGSDNYYPAQDQLYYHSGPLDAPPAVPEPSMIALFVLGAIGAGWTARRRKMA